MDTNMTKKQFGKTCLTVSGLLLAFSSSVFGQLEKDFAAEFSAPFTVMTADAGEMRVVPVAQGLANPFDMAFRRNGDILVTERYTGQLRVIRNGDLLPDPISGVPEVYSEVFRAGLMTIALHPDDDAVIYMTYTKPIQVDGEPEQTVALMRARIQEDRLVDVEEIFVAEGLDRGIAASKLLFTPEKHLLMSLGGAYMYMGLGDYAQDPSVHYGKLLRPGT